MSRRTFLQRASQVGYRRSRKQEKELARRGGGRTTPGSGSKAIKGDVQKNWKLCRVEAKTTRHKSFSIKVEDLLKLQLNAMPADEIPVMVVEFLGEDGRPVAEVGVIPTYVLDDIGLEWSDE